MILDIQNILLLITAVVNITFGFIVFYNGKNKPLNISFCLFCLSAAAWAATLAMFRYTDDLSQAFWWMKSSYVAAIMIANSFTYFALSFPDNRKISTGKKFFIILPPIIFSLIIFSPNFLVKEIVKVSSYKEVILGFYEWLLFAVYFLSFLFGGLLVVWKKYRQEAGIIKIQALYILIGILVPGVIGIVTNLIFPYWYNHRFIWVGPVSSLMMVVFIAYTIIKYRLMDIRIVARRVFIYLGIAIFAYGIFYLITYFYNKTFGSVYSTGAYVAGIFIAPLFVFLFYSVEKGFKIFANKYLFFSLYNYQETINRLTRELNYSINLNKIVNSIVDTIKNTMQLNRAGVLLISEEDNKTKYKIAKVIGFNQQNGISLVENSFLTAYLQKTGNPLVRDELLLLARDSKIFGNKESFKKLHDHMKHIEASLCLPLMSNQKLIGIIVLGSKLSGDAYTKEDLELLSTLSNQAGIAIDNARLYSQIQDLSKNLQQRVNEQTKDLLKTNKELKIKNQLNQELLEMKTDFLRVVNHQMNTPLSVMRNAYAMVKDGTFNAEKGMEYSTAGLERMSQTIYDFWDAFRLEGEKMEMKPEPVDLTTVIDKLVEEKKKLPLTIERKLTLAVNQPNFKIPLVWCDPKKIIHVASNLLDNAVFYTEKGGVTTSYELLKEQNQNKDKNQIGGFLQVNIKDTGVGVSQENKERLFKKFSRGLGSTGLHPDGSGLGLYIAKKIVEGNDGELTYQSEGVGKGSTFSFTLPLYIGQKPPPPSEKDLIEEKANAIMMDTAKNRTLR